MKYVKQEIPLGGGEGSVIHYCLQIGNVEIKLAESRAIKLSPVRRSWVPNLEFLEEFSNFEEVKEIIDNCDDKRLADYIRSELNSSEPNLQNRQIKALKAIIRSIGHIRDKKIESPVYTVHPSYQQMRTFSYAEEIENPEVLGEIERKLEVHNEWRG